MAVFWWRSVLVLLLLCVTTSPLIALLLRTPTLSFGEQAAAPELHKAWDTEICPPRFASYARHPIIQSTKERFTGNLRLFNEQLGQCPYAYELCCREARRPKDDGSFMFYSLEDFRTGQKRAHPIYEMFKLLEVDHGWKVMAGASLNCDSRKALIASLGGVVPKRIIMEFNDTWFSCFKHFRDMNTTKISWTNDIHSGFHRHRIAVQTRTSDIALGTVEPVLYNLFITWHGWWRDSSNQPRFMLPWTALYKSIPWTSVNLVQVPSSAAHYFWLPFNGRPLASTALIGTINRWYPHRQRLKKLIDGVKITHVVQERRDAYACALWAHCACIVTGSYVNYLVAKVYEVTAAGSLLLLHHTIEAAANLQGFVNGVNMVVFNDSNLMGIVDAVHHNCSQFDNLRKAGQQLTMSRHLSFHRTKQILDAIGAFEEKRRTGQLAKKFDRVPGEA